MSKWGSGFHQNITKKTTSAMCLACRRNRAPPGRLQQVPLVVAVRLLNHLYIFDDAVIWTACNRCDQLLTRTLAHTVVHGGTDRIGRIVCGSFVTVLTGALSDGTTCQNITERDRFMSTLSEIFRFHDSAMSPTLTLILIKDFPSHPPTIST